jgi:hypothetical protein
MAITYNWTITNLDRNTVDGFVTTAHWTASAVDGEHTASVYSTVSWPVDEPQIPYDNLTAQIVLEWVWESVDKTATEAALLEQINIKKNPVTASGRPW